MDKLVMTYRLGSEVIQLTWDKHSRGYYLSHYKHGRQLLYEFVGDDLSACCAYFQKFICDTVVLVNLGGPL